MALAGADRLKANTSPAPFRLTLSLAPASAPLSPPVKFAMAKRTGGATGVCCRGATCNTTIAQAACTGNTLAGASFAAAATSCNATGNARTPCCHADYNKLNGIEVQDIFDFINDWLASSPYANVGGTGAPGALDVQNIFDFLNAWLAGGC